MHTNEAAGRTLLLLGQGKLCASDFNSLLLKEQQQHPNYLTTGVRPRLKTGGCGGGPFAFFSGITLIQKPPIPEKNFFESFFHPRLIRVVEWGSRMD